MVQLTIRLDDELHKEVKHMLVDEKKSFNEYVKELVKKDLDERKKE